MDCLELFTLFILILIQSRLGDKIIVSLLRSSSFGHKVNNNVLFNSLGDRRRRHNYFIYRQNRIFTKSPILRGGYIIRRKKFNTTHTLYKQFIVVLTRVDVIRE